MNNPKISFQKEISDINLYPGELLTVWLNRLSETASKRKAVQIELRVTKHGKCELFYSEKNGGVNIRSFKEWENPE